MKRRNKKSVSKIKMTISTGGGVIRQGKNFIGSVHVTEGFT